MKGSKPKKMTSSNGKPMKTHKGSPKALLARGPDKMRKGKRTKY